MFGLCPNNIVKRLLFAAFLLPVFAVRPAAAEPFKVLLSTMSLQPGETLRIEVDGLLPPARIKALFMGKSYPFFVIGPNANRALIGIKLDAKPGTYGLTFKALPYTQLPADALRFYWLPNRHRPRGQSP